MNIRITERERDVLLSRLETPSQLRSAIVSAAPLGREWDISLTDQDADNLRNLCGERWQEIGYDQELGCTETGYILESLIDKLYSE